jgi:F0F1-type ATP synthase assembly protein I
MPPARSSDGPKGPELVGLGIGLAVSVVLPVVGGGVLDSVLHTSPVLLLVGLLVGIAAAVVVVYTRLVKPYM